MWSSARRLVAGAAASTLAASAAVAVDAGGRQERLEASRDSGGKTRGGLPTFTSAEVRAERDRVLVTYRDMVLDVTDFAGEHPGGRERLMEARGGPVEPFWAYWAYHFDSPKPRALLRELQVGWLADPGYADWDADEAVREFYEEDPERSPREHIASTRFPFCSETRTSVLRAHFFTPNIAFYVRNHAPVPAVDEPARHELVFTAHDDDNKPTGGRRVVELRELAEGRLTPRVQFDSVLQCAGNRAREMSERAGKPTAFSDTPFRDLGLGMIGNATWSGYLLRDVLPAVLGADALADEAALHVNFKGLDGYESSVPLARVLHADAMLATHMNGEPLPADHGGPVRAFVPGVAGARSVKWVRAISVERRETDACWQSVYYKDGRDAATPSIQELPLQSLVLSEPAPGDAVVEGVAWGGGAGRAIARVQVSHDGGRSWTNAALGRTGDSNWSWTQWRAQLPRQVRANDVIVCRAFDAAGHGQPAETFNPKGYLYNGWHRVTVA